MNKSIEYMTPAEWLTEGRVWVRSVKDGRGRVAETVFLHPVQNATMKRASDSSMHESHIGLCVSRGMPVSRKSVEKYGIPIPESWTKTEELVLPPAESVTLTEAVSRLIEDDDHSKTLTDVWQIARKYADGILQKLFIPNNRASADDMASDLVVTFQRNHVLDRFDPAKGSLENLVYTALLRRAQDMKTGRGTRRQPLVGAESLNVPLADGGDTTFIDMLASEDGLPGETSESMIREIVEEVPEKTFRGHAAEVQGKSYPPTHKSLVDLMLQGYSKADMGRMFGVTEAAIGQNVVQAIRSLPVDLLKELRGMRESRDPQRRKRMCESIRKHLREHRRTRIIEAVKRSPAMKVEESVADFIKRREVERFIESRQALKESTKVNESEGSRELELFIENDHDLYRSQYTPIIKNLMIKRAKGVYDHNKAVKLFMYLVDAGARKYVKEYDAPDGRPFSREDRLETAESLTQSFETEAEAGNYDKFIPARLQKGVNESTSDQVAGQDHVCTGNCPDCKCGVEQFRVLVVHVSSGSACMVPQYKIIGDKFVSELIPKDKFVSAMQKLVPEFNPITGDSRMYDLKLKDVEAAFGE